MKKAFIAAFAAAFCWGMVACNDSDDVEKLSKMVRKKFGSFLKPLPDIKYIEIFGETPSSQELLLGRMLFNDPVLSRNNDVSCATCHLSNHGFADGNGLNFGSLGEGGPTGSTVGRHFGDGELSLNRHAGDDGYGFRPKRKMFRNSLSTINVGYRVDANKEFGLLWDGRFGNLLFQVLLPLHTQEEMCGQNPLPLKGENIFRKGGPLFDRPVEIDHSHFVDSHSGKDSHSYNFRPVKIHGIPRFRENGVLTTPNRNECLALVVAKIRKIPEYRSLFREAYGSEKVTDGKIAAAIAAFVSTHVSKNTPYDRFVKGENSLGKRQLYGMGIFMTEYGKPFELGGHKLKGAGCVKCHTPPLFEDGKYYSLGVVSDEESSLSRPKHLGNFRGGFFTRPRGIRGKAPKCHIEGVSVLSDTAYAPDIGRAEATSEDGDCFKFRTPTLRNVAETYPYFHHGTEKGQSLPAKDFRERARLALENSIAYHLRGPLSESYVSRLSYDKVFFDKFFQKDSLVPYFAQDFGFANKNSVDFSQKEIQYIAAFIGEGLRDREAVAKGDLGNDVSHPERVPSGFFPSVTRDEGRQFELPPNFDPNADKAGN